jgi:hypothetical protein
MRHDIRTDTFPSSSFNLVHTRAVLMHISPSVDLLQRIATWLAPGGWLLLEEPDFGMWTGDADPVWATAPQTAPKVRAGALSPAEATALIGRPGDDDFLSCGFVHIGVWGQRPFAE